MKYLPSNLRYLRNKKKLSQTDLGKLIGRDHTTISGYESGKRTPSLSDIGKLTDIFHISTHAHASVTMTLNTYSHLWKSELENIVNLIDNDTIVT